MVIAWGVDYLYSDRQTKKVIVGVRLATSYLNLQMCFMVNSIIKLGNHFTLIQSWIILVGAIMVIIMVKYLLEYLKRYRIVGLR